MLVDNWQARGGANAIGAPIGKLLLTVGLFGTNGNADVDYVWMDEGPALPDVRDIILAVQRRKSA